MRSIEKGQVHGQMMEVRLVERDGKLAFGAEHHDQETAKVNKTLLGYDREPKQNERIVRKKKVSPAAKYWQRREIRDTCEHSDGKSRQSRLMGQRYPALAWTRY
jgi:hypothetical protein